MPSWTTNEIPDLAGKTALVTGANSGLGLETARALAARGAKVVLTCRSAAKAQAAMEDIRATHPDAHLAALTLDLADLASVKQCAEDYKKDYSRLDILCNNAGVMGLPKAKTKDGFEIIFGVNYLGHFALTGLLFGVIRATPGARVVSLSSRTHKNAPLPLDDLNWQRRRYSMAGAYGQSKLANLVFAFELERRLRQANNDNNTDAISVAAHPGYAATNVVFPTDAEITLARRIWIPLAKLGNALMAQSAAEGALPTLYAVTMPDVKGGEYYGPDGFSQLRGGPAIVACAPLARDAVVAHKLWTESEKLTGVKFL